MNSKWHRIDFKYAIYWVRGGYLIYRNRCEHKYKVYRRKEDIFSSKQEIQRTIKHFVREFTDIFTAKEYISWLLVCPTNQRAEIPK